MLNFKKFGNSENSLIILHGLFGSLDNWQSLARLYSEHFTVYIIDARNHGKSFHSEEFNYEVMTEDLYTFMNVHNIQSAFLIGHSMGGKTAMFFSVKYPELIDKLIVADIGPKAYPVHHRDILDVLLGLNLHKDLSRAEAEKYLEQHFDEKSLVFFFGKNLYWNEAKQLDWKFNLKVINDKIEEVGIGLNSDSRFEKPTIFIRGEKSNYIKDTDFETIKKHFPQSEISTISNAGHWLHAEQPQAFFEQTLSFLIS